MDKVMLTERLAKQIRVLRAEHKYPARYIARKIEVSPATYSRYENGGLVTIPYKVLKDLEEVYKVRLVMTEDDLYTRIEELERENSWLRQQLSKHNNASRQVS